MEVILTEIPRLFTAISEWAACMVYVSFLRKRFVKWKFVGISVVALFVLCGVHYVAGLLPIPLWIPGMLIAVLIMFLFIWTIAGVNVWVAACQCVQAFILAELASSLEWQLYYYFALEYEFINSFVWKYLFLAIIYGLVFLAMLLLESRYMKDKAMLDMRGKDFLSILGVAIAVFLLSNISFLSSNTPFSGRYTWEIFYIRTLVDFCGVIILYTFREQRLWFYIKKELDAVQNVLYRQYEQYCRYKENIELINKTYHDLKHQISIIRSEQNPDKKSEYIDELEKGIKLYEAQYNTGNSVLDVVLTAKGTECLDLGINFTCVADGKLLNFMNAMDISSIVGNALDNAIENVKNINTPDKKIIKLAIYAQGDLVLIRFENYYSHDLVYDNGDLVTTKDNKRMHGYGLKSIKHVAAKYGGATNITTQNNWFVLCILIPFE